MTTGLVIFARMGSSRLPGKSLMDIGGRSLLGRVLDRTRRIRCQGTIVIATSDQAEDEPIARFAEVEGVALFHGDLHNVAGRALACARRYRLARFARICGDRPFFDPGIVDRLLDMQAAGRLDLSTNAGEHTFPAGATGEVVSTPALERVLAATRDPEDLEHVTRYFYRCPAAFRIANLASRTPEDAEISLAVDTELDLERARWIVARLDGPPADASLGEVTRLARAWYKEAAGAGAP